MSTLIVKNLDAPTGESIVAPDLQLPSGSVVQVQSVFKDTVYSQSISAQTDVDVTDLSVTITPKSTSSKIMIFGRIFYEYNGYDPHDMGFYFRRNGTKIGAGQSDGQRNSVIVTPATNYTSAGNYNSVSTPEVSNFFHIDSPNSTQALTYTIGVNAGNAGTLYVNFSANNNNLHSRERGSSEIILMEIAG